MAEDYALDRKFRRILFIHQASDVRNILGVLWRYANDVAALSFDNYFAADYLQLPADCLVIDARVTPAERGGVSTSAAVARRRGLPTIVICGEGFKPADFAVLDLLDPDFVWDNRQLPIELEAFLDRVPAVDHQELCKTVPWAYEPWTVSADTMFQSFGHTDTS